MKTFKDMGIETAKPWTPFHRHQTRRPAVLCKATKMGPGGVSCPCCNKYPGEYKRMTAQAIRREGKKEITNQLND